MGQRLDRIEQAVYVVDAKDAGTAERRIVGVVAAGESAGMRCGGAGALLHAATADGHDWLVAGGRARGREKLPRVPDRLDVQQNRSRARVRAEIVDEVAEIDIGGIPDRDKVGEADIPCQRPVEHCGDQGSGLRTESDATCLPADVREAGDQADFRSEERRVGKEYVS